MLARVPSLIPFGIITFELYVTTVLANGSVNIRSFENEIYEHWLRFLGGYHENMTRAISRNVTFRKRIVDGCKVDENVLLVSSKLGFLVSHKVVPK